jgi:two-component system sensor histidine kinase TtrS
MEEVPGHRFEIVPLGFGQVQTAVEREEVEFILVNSGIYVNLEVRYRISRIATLRNEFDDQRTNRFGGVIFTRAERDDLTSLQDLRGSRFMAVDRTSLGGFQMAWWELLSQGIDPHRDLAGLDFDRTHDRVVMDVLQGRADAGTVRTDILERMAAEGKIDLDQFKILGARQHPDFNFLHSTPLFPEWPFSVLRHADKELAQQVAIALLQMNPDDPAAIAGGYGGWSIPLDYQPVHDLFKSLKLPPYDRPARFTLIEAIKRYWYWVLGGAFILLFMALMTGWVVRLNRALKMAKRHLEEEHELILNSVADGIYGVDLKGHSTFFNRAAEEITGWKAEEVIQRNQHDLLHHTRADGSPYPLHECPVYQTFRDDRPCFIDDDLFWRKDGTSIPVEYSSTPIRDHKGGIRGSVVVFRDITARKEAEEAAAQHCNDLAHMSRLSTMGEMASGLAHELNQPLTAVATNTHTCIHLMNKEAIERERVLTLLERAASQAERAGLIIHQLLLFMRKEEPQRAPVDLNKLVVEVLQLLRVETKRGKVNIHLDLANDLPLLKVQPIQIEQVLLNLLRNAMEAMDALDADQGQRGIWIATSPASEEAVLVEVRDNGQGISAELRERLFDPFVTNKQKGVGLGLSISKRIVESHGGRLYLDSEYEQGARFLFVLPIRPEVTL